MNISLFLEVDYKKLVWESRLQCSACQVVGDFKLLQQLYERRNCYGMNFFKLFKIDNCLWHWSFHGIRIFSKAETKIVKVYPVLIRAFNISIFYRFVIRIFGRKDSLYRYIYDNSRCFYCNMHTVTTKKPFWGVRFRPGTRLYSNIKILPFLIDPS